MNDEAFSFHTMPTHTDHNILTTKAQEEWLTFVELCFADKGTPKSYFHNQLVRESSQHLIVVIRNSKSIVSTLRIFRRVILGGASHQQIKVAGIGSVCTHPKYRKQGLSSRLIQFAQKIIQESGDFDISLLHAAPQFHSFYKSNGYIKQLQIEKVLIEIQGIEKSFSTSSYIIRTCDSFCSNVTNDVAVLNTLHNSFNQNLPGTDVRNDAFWLALTEQYKDSIFVCLNQDDVPLAYCCVIFSSRDQKWILSDFGIEQDFVEGRSDDIHLVVEQLLAHAIHHQTTEAIEVTVDTADAAATNILVPLSICTLLRKSGEQVVDDGWLYYNVNKMHSNDSLQDTIATRWKMDSF